jgi:16S rRNA (uracil1498-N3)-methyltransferase
MAARYSSGPRIFLSDARLLFSDPLPKRIELTDNESHYLRDVLRLKSGEVLEVGDPATGVIGLATIESLTAAGVTITITAWIADDAPKQRELFILCALCKGDKNDQICDWSTELGCRAIHFWQSPRSVVRLKSAEDFKQRESRLSKIAVAAAQQSRQRKPPEVRVHSSLEIAITELKRDRYVDLYFCSLEPGIKLLSDVIRSADDNKPALLIVGPEGDPAPEEISFLREHACATPVSLGPSILRSELAVVSAVATVRARLVA